eukprot:UN33768
MGGQCSMYNDDYGSNVPDHEIARTQDKESVYSELSDDKEYYLSTHIRPKKFAVWLEQDFVPEGMFLKIEHPVEMYYVEAGKDIDLAKRRDKRKQKPYLILMHGEFQCCFSFRKVLEKLEKKFHILIPDLIGCGKSVK